MREASPRGRPGRSRPRQAQARSDLVERDQHQIRTPGRLDRSDLVLAASQSGAIWFYYEPHSSRHGSQRATAQRSACGNSSQCRCAVAGPPPARGRLRVEASSAPT